MGPKGTIAYIVGLLLLFASSVPAGVAAVYAVILERDRPQMPVAILLISAVLVFAALHVLLAGLYRMLGHVYRAISRTDQVSDRPLRGRTIFLLGQIAMAMTFPVAGTFVVLSDRNVARAEREAMALVLGAPVGLAVVASVLTLLVGLGLMVRDIFMRHQDIVDLREAERRRRIDAGASAAQEEEIPVVGVPPDLRDRVRRDR
jgi:hypothetical protein